MYAEVDEKTGLINLMALKPEQVGILEYALSTVKMNNHEQYNQAQQLLNLIETQIPE